MKTVIWIIIAVPLAVLLVVASVINRQPVTLSLDPFSQEAPALALSLPFFVWLFLAGLAGMLVGGLVTWIKQSPHRRSARRTRHDADRWRREAEQQKARADELAAAAMRGVGTAAPAGGLGGTGSVAAGGANLPALRNPRAA